MTLIRRCFNVLTSYQHLYAVIPISSQPAHDVRTTLYGRHFNVLKSFQRPYDVVLTSGAGWVMSVGHDTWNWSMIGFGNPNSSKAQDQALMVGLAILLWGLNGWVRVTPLESKEWCLYFEMFCGYVLNLLQTKKLNRI